ncbi:MAG: M20/M25/M40 family metallo-hydrolase [Lachnospiraceae bacterium]|nr:M20/M25/M40 family metallo-hydrolase [Ruminococcus sp.]MCM1274016.1 M20/M25/M40 family metallo-hydrolase [Lachnospiraceae bacterium]
MDIKAVLKTLTDETGVSGDEFPAAAKAAELLSRYARDVSVDDFGNVTGYVKSGLPNAKTLLLDAHIDRVGLIVTYIDDKGFLSVGACGSPDIKTYLAQSVTVHGKRDVSGVVSTLPPHVSKDNKAPDIDNISIDVGMTKTQAEEVISLGDRVTVNSRFGELCGDVVSASAVDDRAGVCAILQALDMLSGKSLKYDLAICFSAQEETGERGAKQAAFRIQPDEAIAVDVSFGRTPDSDPKETAELGSGVMIGFSACLDKGMSNALRELAKRENIPFTCEVMPSSTGTNADAVGVVGKGSKCCTLSFPIRYMHTSVETVNLNDISAAARLIAAYAGGEANG